MSKVCVNGAGIAGLVTALLLARDGHDVTVVERDPPPPSRDPEEVWSGWERRAVPQFRQTHAFHGRMRRDLRHALPHVWTRLVEAGIHEHDLAGNPPPTVRDSTRLPGDDELVVVCARRPVVENVLRSAADDDPRIEVLSSLAVKGLLVDEGAAPHVTGLATSAGEVEADIVVDCGGRRSALADWIEEAGGVRPQYQAADYRIAYWTQWFRLRPGAAMPTLAGRPAEELGPIEVLRVPADNAWFSITIVATADDKRFRLLSDQARLHMFLRRLDLTRDWVDPDVAEPVGPILPMFPLVDSRRRLVMNGRPCATGVVGVGDSACATNPTLARGATFALMHAICLRDLLRSDTDSRTVTERHESVLHDDFDPWWDATVAADQLHLDRMRAAASGSNVHADPAWMFLHAAQHDPALWRHALRIVGVFDLPAEVVTRSGVPELVGRTLERVGPPTIAELDVDALLAR